MAKMLAFDQEAREAVKPGAGKLTRTVRSTLGRYGRTVLLAKSFGPPNVTKDGVTVAKEIDLEDPLRKHRHVTTDHRRADCGEAKRGKKGPWP